MPPRRLPYYRKNGYSQGYEVCPPVKGRKWRRALVYDELRGRWTVADIKARRFPGHFRYVTTTGRKGGVSFTADSKKIYLRDDTTFTVEKEIVRGGRTLIKFVGYDELYDAETQVTPTTTHARSKQRA
jgi:hypothetical protein